MLQIRRFQVDTGEYQFLRSFLETDFFDRFCRGPGDELTIVEEPYTGFGYADAVGVVYDQSALGTWSDDRKRLKDDDIKILHHLYLSKRGRCFESLVFELGFPDKRLKRSVERLFKADVVVHLKDGRIKSKPASKIFFVKEIIAVEAKLKNWKAALVQSKNNLSFCSRSYSLFPRDVVSSGLKDRYLREGVGVIAHGGKYKIEVPSVKKSIPSTLSSWYFNEYVGRGFL